MGCLAIQKQRKVKIATSDFKIIWIKCLHLQAISKHQSTNMTHPAFLQISKDIDRTFPDNPQFSSIQVKHTLENVLRLFALEFPKIGYTQGLNFVAGVLILNNLDQRQVINTLIALCTKEDLMMLGLYQDEFPLCRLYCQLFWQILEITNPKSYKIIKKLNLPDEIWIFQWFITLFVYSLPISYMRQIFNFIIVKRYFAAVRLAVGIFQMLEKYLGTEDYGQDRFIECILLIKREEFCKKYLPLETILSRAEKIKKGMIMECLKDSKTNNYYKYYFLCAPTHREKKYQRFLQDLEKQREIFMKENDGSSSRYTRQLSSVQIIDSIEQSKVKCYEKVLSRSSQQKIKSMFSNLTDRRVNSVGFARH